MTESWVRDLAAQAGVDPSYASALLELGILKREHDGSASPGAVRRVRMVRSLEQAGISLEELAAALRDGSLSFAFLDVPVFDRFASLTGTTFRELSATTSVPIDLLMVVREAIGFAQPTPDDLVRADEHLIVPAIEQHVARGLRSAVIERWLRVYGDSLRRMAETEADWWRTEIEQPLIASGVGEGVVLDVAAEWGAQTAPLVDQAVLAMYHAHEEHAWLANIIGNVENALERAGLRSKLERPPAVCFLDLTGYTRMTEERGDEAAAEQAAGVAHLVQRTSQQHRGKAVKWLGDGVMFYFRDAAPSVAAALEMMDGVASAGLPRAHVGLHAGPVVFQEGDYFGRTVNIAARITEYARPGEVLVSQAVVDVADTMGVTFTEVGPIDLKGITGAVHLHVASRDREPPSR